MVCSSRRVLFFRAVLECKKLKTCVYFFDGYREFSLYASLERGRERVRMKDGKKLRNIVRKKKCLFVYVNVCGQCQLVYQADKQSFKDNSLLFIPASLAVNDCECVCMRVRQRKGIMCDVRYKKMFFCTSCLGECVFAILLLCPLHKYVSLEGHLLRSQPSKQLTFALILR